MNPTASAAAMAADHSDLNGADTTQKDNRPLWQRHFLKIGCGVLGALTAGILIADYYSYPAGRYVESGDVLVAFTSGDLPKALRGADRAGIPVTATWIETGEVRVMTGRDALQYVNQTDVVKLDPQIYPNDFVDMRHGEYRPATPRDLLIYN